MYSHSNFVRISVNCPSLLCGLYGATNMNPQTHKIFKLLLSLSRDIDLASYVLVGCILRRCWVCQRKYTVLGWNPGVLRQTVKFGHYSCNSAFMVCSQGPCAQPPQQSFAVRSADRDEGIISQEAQIKIASCVHV